MAKPRTISPTAHSTGEEPPEFIPHFFSRILRSLPYSKREVPPKDNGVIPDADTPADLDKILGPHGTLDPSGYLRPQIVPADDTTEAVDPHDSPNGEATQQYDLPDSAVDEASPEVDQILKAGELDQFGQAGQSEGIEDTEDAADRTDSAVYLTKLNHFEHEGEDGDLGDPQDVQDFVSKFLDGGSS
ncbi:hypothetical protein BU23DRAFT_566906 [Bimuria novae-zelandiae CBS 107.79]|uniref:Uncharacterized protein n=1 Tax=Bimuria novae-zelandiae CBS 107.79 TaxID=1447943 RepID=A0A6A5VE06_9PLEO|nr:hypothetical protein BU23DRAFT_566906 [Bimuria novae-zelandiae CBS 107.79]